MSGIRAEIAVESPPDCPAATASEATGATATSITKSVPTDPTETVTEEFVLDEGSVDPAGPQTGAEESRNTDLDEGFQEVFSYGSERVYRFERSQDRTCFCECIEQFGCPVRDVHSRDGSLTVSFHAPDVDTLRSVVARLDERWSNVSVRRLVRSDADRDGSDLVLVDRGELTTRQREVLETAHEMGYFEYPKRANAGEVADELGIDDSTFVEHLSAAQGKLLATILR